jgi:uncharacterized protein YqhQ
MALANGVLLIGPTSWSAAVRDRNGRIRVADGKRPVAPRAVDAFPIVRGPIRLLEMLAVLPLMRKTLPQARLMVEAAPTIVALSLSSVASTYLRKRIPIGAAAEFAATTASLAATLGVTKFSELGRYHGAEHKVIGAYEQDLDAGDATKEHERCGTHLALPMLISSALVSAVARKTMRNKEAATFVGSIIGVGAAVELVRRSTLQPDHLVSRAIAGTGHTVQRLAATREPNAEQLEVAEAALERILEVERAA